MTQEEMTQATTCSVPQCDLPRGHGGAHYNDNASYAFRD